MLTVKTYGTFMIIFRSEVFQKTSCTESKTHILCSITFFFLKSSFFLYNVELYGTTRQATEDNKIRCVRFAFWTSKAADTHSEYVILIAFSTATTVTRTRPVLTFIRAFPLLFALILVLLYVSTCTEFSFGL